MTDHWNVAWQSYFLLFQRAALVHPAFCEFWRTVEKHEWATGCRVNGLDCPTGAVAYTEEAFNALIAEAGLQRVGDYARGAWSGFFKDAMDGQDIAILAKGRSPGLW